MLKLNNLTKSFGTLKAVDDLTVSIAPGEVFGLLGPNGAGKSTTVMMIAGQVEPDAGDVDIGGHGSPTVAANRQQLGVAPQSLSLYDDLTAGENLRFFGSMHGLGGSALGSAIQSALTVVNLTDRADERIKGFSGGMKRRLNLAVALLHNPAYLLLDEPTVGVDPQSRNAILDNVATLQEQGRGILYTTHYMEEVERICHRVGIMDHGRLLACDSVESLVDAHGGPSQLRITRTDGEILTIETRAPLAELRQFEPDAVADFRVTRPNLETVFLNLTGRALRD